MPPTAGASSGASGVEHRNPDLVGRDTHHDQYAGAGSKQAANDAHGGAFEQELYGDMAAGGADRAPEPNLRGSLHHPYKRDIGDPKRTHRKRQAAE